MDKTEIPEFAKYWDDAETNEEYWWNRPLCADEDCRKKALSYHDRCWDHLSGEERDNWRVKLLKKSDLKGLELNKANLEGADLREADLERANLKLANLEGADLRDANLKGADLKWANLEGADLGDANLKGAVLWRANLEGADLYLANLDGAILMMANLEGADLREADLERANLKLANLEGAELYNARLERANLCGANLEGGDLSYANLEGADLDLANLEGADLSYAKFGRTGLIQKKTPIVSEEKSSGDKQFLEDAKIEYKPVTNISGVTYNPHTRIYIFPLAIIKWFLLWNWSRIEKYVRNRYIEFTMKRKGHFLDKNPKYWFYSITMLWFIKDYFRHKLQLKRIRNFVYEQRIFIRERTEKKLGITSKFVCLFSIFSFIKRFFIWVCENILGFMDPKRPGIARYKQTKLYGIDTTDLDSSKNPQLIRDIHYQQFLDAFKKRRPKWFYRPAYFLWGLTSFFGESLLLWLLWAGVIIMLFAALFYYTNCCFYMSLIPLQKMEISYFTDAIYLSSIAFTSLGLGNYEPANSLAKWLIIAEVMLGFIMLGSLVSFFANKFVRRD